MTYKSLISVLLLMGAFKGSSGLTAQQITITDKKGDFEVAQDVCKSLQLYLIRVENDDENTFVNNLVTARGIEKYWMDGNDLDFKGKFINWKNDQLKYTKWGAAQPDSSSDFSNCIEARSDQLWYNVPCNNANAIVCLDPEVYPPPDNGQLDKDDVTLPNKQASIDEAQTYCNKLGLKIVRINNDAENNLMNDLTVAKNIDKFWIDTKRGPDGTSWVNSDNAPASFTNWSPGQPDNSQGNENCVQVGKSKQWEDVVCSLTNNVACYIYHLHYPKVSTDITPPQIVVTDKSGDFATAQSVCTNLGLRVVRLKNNAESKVVKSVIASKNVNSFWTDANDIKKEGSWVNSHNLPIKFTKWATGKPDNAGGAANCAAIDASELWTDTACTDQKTIVCYNKDKARTPPTVAPVVPPTVAPIVPPTVAPTVPKPSPIQPPSTLKQSDIVFTDKKGDFQTALKICQDGGMKIIRIKSDEENEYIAKLAAAKNIDKYWIDGIDVKIEGNWLNSDDLALRYKKWGPNQPDNLKGNEHCVEVDKTQLWNDIRCNTQNAIICFRERPRCQKPTEICKINTCPKIKSYLTPDDIIITNKRGDFLCAQNVCKSLGLGVISIKNDIDNKLVHDLSIIKQIGRYWIDGNDIVREGTWINSSNKFLSYTKWQLGEPNNLNFKEHCAEGHFFGTETWNDMDCKALNGIICGKSVCNTCTV